MGTPMTHHVLRVGLVLLAAIQFAVGGWQYLAPESFFALEWVAGHPPFNDHLMRDVGGLNLALGVVMAGAAIVMERRLVITALLGHLTFTATHLIYHVGNSGHFEPASIAAQLTALGVWTLAPLALLPLAWRAR